MFNRALISSLLFAAFVVAAAPPAAAQPVRRAEPETAKPADPVPQSSTATFGNWNLACQQGTGSGQARHCEVSQTILDAKQQPLLQVAAGVDPNGRRTFVIVTPVNVRVETPIILKIEGSPFVLKAPLRYCLPAGCFADTDLSDADLATLRAKPDAKAGLDVMTAAKTIAHVPLSLLGFDPAWAAFARELKGK